ncbi:MAG: hypothetical protein JWL59_1953 [Chthoniobacteraceae bacterium]|nr:hypothetical protein [Chthoniobacteraceae bacterium]
MRRVVSILAAGLLAGEASASIVLDLRATELNGAPLSGANTSKNISGLKTGDVLTFSLHADVTGASGNTAAEGIQLLYFSLFTSSGGLLGDFANNVSLNPVFSNGAQPGQAHDLDGDGDLDLGSTSASATTASPANSFPGTSYVAARSSTVTTTGTPILDGTEFFLGITTFTITSVADSGAISANFYLPTFTVGVSRISALWQEDGATKQIGSSKTGVTAIGTPVLLSSVPEPSAAILLVAGTLGLLTRRRSRE